MSHLGHTRNPLVRRCRITGEKRRTRRPVARTSSPNVAERLAAVARSAFGGVLPIRLSAWDGSAAGPQTAPTVVIHSPQALRRLLFHRPELALAQAYVTGELDVEGDLLDAFRRVWATVREHGMSGRPRLAALVSGLRTAFDLGVV